MKRAMVRGVGHYLPEKVVPNAYFETLLDTSDDWIRSRSGIERRHFAAEGETTSQMAVRAAEAALDHAGLNADALDAVIVATSTPDLTFPSVATMVQAALGMRAGFAFDIQAVCAGFVYAMANANALIVSGQVSRVMIIGAETFSQILDWTDRGTCVLFGDGAGALIVEAAEGDGTNDDRGILSIDLHSDGRFRDILYVDGGVSTQATGQLRMEGKEVFRHAVEKLAQTAHAALGQGRPHRGRGRLGGAAPGQPADHQGHRAEDGRADGAGDRHRPGPRQHLGRLDPARAFVRGGARSDPAGPAHRDRGNRWRSGLGVGGPALVAPSRRSAPPSRQLKLTSIPRCLMLPPERGRRRWATGH